MAGEPGFEPGLTESESVGLPLTYSPVDAFWRAALGGAAMRGLIAAWGRGINWGEAKK